MATRSSSATKRKGSTRKKPTRKKTARKKATTKRASSVRKTAQKITPTDNIKRNPLGHLLMEKMFREAGFRGGISSDKKLLDAYSTDESIFSVRPQVVIQPKNRRDVEIATKIVAKESKRFTSLSLTPRAAGTGLGGGSLTDSVVIDMCAHLNKFGSITKKKDTYTFTTEPGAMWRDVEKKLKDEGLYLPSFPASKDICSIGGSIANNAAGPDSLRHGHCASWIEALEVVLMDGHTYTVKPLSYREYKMLIKQKHEYARIAKEIFELISKNEKEIHKNKPNTKKNSAGYPLWSVMPDGVAKFKKGNGTFDLTQLIAGSQGTIGIITHLTLRAIPVPEGTTLIALPIFNLEDAAEAIVKALEYNPINVEVFDDLSFNLALQNPSFFKDRIARKDYYRVMLAMYTTYHVRFKRKVPEFTVLITLDKETTDEHNPKDIVKEVGSQGVQARVVTNKHEAEMYWQIRRASYTL